MTELVQKAQTLIEALPYIKNFYGKTFVIKYGGHAMLDEDLRRQVILDWILLKYIGVHPVIVHGGGPAIDHYLKQLGKVPQFLDGLRVTDTETMEIVQMVLVGKVNLEIVSLINKLGGKAVGLSGKDGNLILARKHISRENGDLGWVGDVESIHPELLISLSNSGIIPVVSSVGVGLDGESYNINADLVAGELAAALGAAKLIMLTDVEGIFADPANPSTLISALSVDRAQRMIADGSIGSGMIPKVEACMTALEAGVSRTHIVDGRSPHSILLEIFTDKGIGTMVVP